jgi:sialic acid synthase SpsE/mannose-6-phosphate isomerase-like protein (cupin superfamily)
MTKGKTARLKDKKNSASKEKQNVTQPNFLFDDLFILDIANNHQGDVDHGLEIIQSIGAVVKETGVNAAIKFQFRQLETFIHPDYLERTDIKHIPRFVSTRLDLTGYQKLLDKTREVGLYAMCTPFDEESVTLIQDMGFDAIKIASCSVTDRPLLQEVSRAKMPVVVSTGGATIPEIEYVVHILNRGEGTFALEHCVSIYPTPMHSLNLNQIRFLKDHFRDIPVGWSTHEDPDDCTTVQLAIAKGATLFERHVGIPNEKYDLNKYSSTPEQVGRWISAYREGKIRCGSQRRGPSSVDERQALNSLKRGVYANQKIRKGDKIRRENVFFAMPLLENQLACEKWESSIIAGDDYLAGKPIKSAVISEPVSEETRIQQILSQARGMLHEARIKLNPTSSIELSHHYGLEHFREFGAIIISVINREYCKKLVIQLPRQKHPYHFHEKKEETFQVLFGEVEVEKEGNPNHLQTGDLFLVERGKWHKFSTLEGVIFEEISTTHHNDDSIYEDEAISAMPRSSRKTLIAGF